MLDGRRGDDDDAMVVKTVMISDVVRVKERCVVVVEEMALWYAMVQRRADGDHRALTS